MPPAHPPQRVVLVTANRWSAEWTEPAPRGRVDRMGLLAALTRLGWPATLANTTPAPLNPFAGRHSLLESLDPVRALRLLLGRGRADVLLCCYEGAALLPLLLRGLCRFRGAVILHDLGEPAGWRLRRWVQDRVVPRADAVVVLSTAQRDEVLKLWRPRGAVRVILDYVDTGFFRPAPEGAEEALVLSVGDDGARDYPTLLAAAEGAGWPLLLKTRLVAPAPGRTVIAERISDGALRALYARARVVALPLVPRNGAGGVTAFLEAAAMGRAIVVSASPGLADYARHEETCLVVPAGDAAALRGAIGRLLGDAGLRARLGAGARGFVERHCSHAAHAAGWVRIFEEVAGGRT